MKRNQTYFLLIIFLLIACACSVTVGGQGDQAQTPPVTTSTLELPLPLKNWIFPEVPAPFQKRIILPENMAWAENPAVASIVVSSDSSSLEVNSTDQNEKLNKNEPDSNSSVLPMATPDTPPK